MIVLAIDTATDAPGIALRTSEATTVRSIGWRESFGSTVPEARALLDEAQIDVRAVDAVAVPAGPGSFTGLRVGATIALGLARAGETALHAVPTLVAIAAARAPSDAPRVVATLDARRGRWYGAVVAREPGGWATVDGPYDAPWDEVESLDRSIPLVGREEDERAEPLVARALAGLVAEDPARWRVEDLRAFRLLYARPGAERR